MRLFFRFFFFFERRSSLDSAKNAKRQFFLKRQVKQGFSLFFLPNIYCIFDFLSNLFSKNEKKIDNLPLTSIYYHDYYLLNVFSHHKILWSNET